MSTVLIKKWLKQRRKPLFQQAALDTITLEHGICMFQYSRWIISQGRVTAVNWNKWCCRCSYNMPSSWETLRQREEIVFVNCSKLQLTKSNDAVDAVLGRPWGKQKKVFQLTAANWNKWCCRCSCWETLRQTKEIVSVNCS